MELDLFGSPAAEANGVATDAPLASSAPATTGTPIHTVASPATASDSASLAPGAGPRRAPTPGERVIMLDGHALYYRFKRSSRRTIGFMIDESGLAVTAPRWVTIADVEAAVVEKKRWIFSKIAEFRERAARRVIPRVTWIDGASLPYLGHTLTVRLGGRSGAAQYDIHTHTLWLDLPPQAASEQMRDRVQGWLQQEARKLFTSRLDVYGERLGVRYSALGLSSATTRWGSCSADGRIRLNWRLIHFPLGVIDYVVAHELAHLKEMNHGPRFWQAVASIFPEFEAARDTLKSHAPEWLPEF
ncbi:metal-dependent hydrolase [Pandoraea oxalativorans]|uniref:Metal-dependent hydrolase n=2 Tax=Pandoraea oxalativorans TaxID=573737 RepID=A0A0E3Y866_9BURK|nr:SprT family zinc-dependent metalloprotease [Pandoraea oxalativorans]AKC68351.1 metal-dependent hydrolase [Pandoraea oxalativorans]